MEIGAFIFAGDLGKLKFHRKKNLILDTKLMEKNCFMYHGHFA